MAIDPYEEWLSIPAERRPPNYDDLLGLNAFGSSAENRHV